ncbi:unnamed protein product [Gulo gulo]|uniref:Uncharacterized protein n=1 Tax=Gulo gulo TaxID=48420 RepID=A0A9X9PUM0_GULGU|nr:unnamed protein product [Gulo gulo]
MLPVYLRELKSFSKIRPTIKNWKPSNLCRRNTGKLWVVWLEHN